MGIGSLVCIVNFLIIPVANLLMRLGCQGKGTKGFKILTGNDFFQTWKQSS